jgi:hypothetical protein
MAARLPKILFTTTAPIFALSRFLSLHWSRNMKRPMPGSETPFRPFFFYGIGGPSLEQIGLGVSEDLSVELHMSAMRVSPQVDESTLRKG